MAEQQMIAWGWSKDRGQYFANLWRLYRVNAEKFQRFWAIQDGKCGGCKRPLAHPIIKSFQTGFKPEADHDHKLDIEAPNYARGILCHKCNDLLGKLQDNQETLQGLSDYLLHHGKSLHAVL